MGRKSKRNPDDRNETTAGMEGGVSTLVCPECGEEFEDVVVTTLEVGDEIGCDECENVFAVSSLTPLTVELVGDDSDYDDDADYDEDEDEDGDEDDGDDDEEEDEDEEEDDTIAYDESH